MNQDDDLDRALRALPLEEPPPGLHQAIMAATIYRPAAPFKAWEAWALGTVAAIGLWLALVFRSGAFSDDIASGVHACVRTLSGVTFDLTALLWLGAGVSIVLWVGNMDIPALSRAPRRGIR